MRILDPFLISGMMFEFYAYILSNLPFLMLWFPMAFPLIPSVYLTLCPALLMYYYVVPRPTLLISIWLFVSPLMFLSVSPVHKMKMLLLSQTLCSLLSFRCDQDNDDITVNMEESFYVGGKSFTPCKASLLAVSSGVTGMILMWIPSRNPAGGLGGAVSPPAGFGAAPRKFLKFMVSFTSEDLFWQILENFLVFCCWSFQRMKGRFARCDCLLPSLVCVCLDGTTQNLFHMFSSCPQIRSPLASISAVYFYSTSTLQLLNNVWTLVFFDVERHCTFPTLTGVSPALHESSLSHCTTEAVL